MSETKRFTGIQTERIAAGGGFDEWFEIATTITTGDFLEAKRQATSTDEFEFGVRILARTVRAWSLQDASGAPVPVSYEKFLELPFPLLEPALTHISKTMSFLGRSTSAS